MAPVVQVHRLWVHRRNAGLPRGEVQVQLPPALREGRHGHLLPVQVHAGLQQACEEVPEGRRKRSVRLMDSMSIVITASIRQELWGGTYADMFYTSESKGMRGSGQEGRCHVWHP